MSRKYLNERWCIRCGRNTPTPYLKKNLKLFPNVGFALDIGCGNGRNSKFMLENGYDVDAIDMAPPGFGIKRIIGVDPLPDKKYDIILANYILMFLNQNERDKVMSQMLARSKENTVVMIEMYPAKDAFKYNFETVVDFFIDNNYTILRKSKDRCVLKYLKTENKRNGIVETKRV